MYEECCKDKLIDIIRVKSGYFSEFNVLLNEKSCATMPTHTRVCMFSGLRLNINDNNFHAKPCDKIEVEFVIYTSIHYNIKMIYDYNFCNLFIFALMYYIQYIL